MLFDLKFAVRQFFKRPGFTAVAVLILALGIGSNTAVFTVIDTLLLRGLPVRAPGELVAMNARGMHFPASYLTYTQLRRRATSVSGIIGFSSAPRSMIATGMGRSDVNSAFTSAVSGDFFSFLGVPPAVGRTLGMADDRPGAPRTAAVLSSAYWKKAFGGDPGVVGKTIVLDNVPFTIVGIAPRGFSGVEVGSPTDIWVPLGTDRLLAPSDSVRFDEATASEHYWIQTMARLRPGVTLREAQAELTVIVRAELLREGFPQQGVQSWGIGNPTLSPAGSGYIANRATVASLLNVLLLVVGMVLVIACANVASLLLARSAARQREFALRSALGAARRHLIRQFLVESTLLAVVAGVLGLLFAHWGTAFLSKYLPTGDFRHPQIDGRILAFALAVSLATGILVGLLPAIRLGRLDVIAAIKNQSSTLAGGTGQRLSRFLVAAQIAISLCLLAGSGLFIRTLQNLRNADVGFERDHVATTALIFDAASNNTQRINLSRELWTELQSLPGIEHLTFSWAGGGLMTHEDNRADGFSVDGYVPNPNDPRQEGAHTAFVGPDFFKTFGIELHAGRTITASDVFPTEADRVANNVVVVNEAFVQKFFPHENPLGHVVHVTSDGAAPPYRIIGVVNNTRQWDLREGDAIEMYFPATATMQMAENLPPPVVILELKTAGDPEAMSSAVRKAVNSIDPKLRTFWYITMDDIIGQSLFQERMIAQTASVFSLFALILASLGLYGILAYNVTQRAREIGLRMALGARAASGCAVGTLAAAALAHLIASRLYGVPPVDPLTFLATVGILLLVALLACWLPARRATKVDPMIALRSE